MKRWLVTCCVNYCADKTIKVIVKANTERKARILAEKQLRHDGHYAIHILYCEQMEEQKHDNSSDESSGS